MSPKNSKTGIKKGVFLSQIMSVITDILYAYKNFIHWNVSKILISLWCFTLGLLVSLPVFILAIIAGFADKIDWSDIIAYSLSGGDISYQIIGGIASHPYSLIIMIFLLLVATFLFLLGSSYSLFLKAELSLGYVKGKKLKYKKNHYFNRPYIFRYMGIMCWNIMYLLAPITIWVGLTFFMYLFFNIGFISFDGLSVLMGFYTVVLILAELYLVYRIIFGYILLADDGKKKNLSNARHYVQKSIEITKGKTFFKFIVLYFLYVLLITPTTLFDNYLENRGVLMRDTLIYNSGLLENLEPEQIAYYEYISQEYNDMSFDELNSKLSSLATLRFILYFVSYLVLSGVFVLLLTSFYRRVLLQK